MQNYWHFLGGNLLKLEENLHCILQLSILILKGVGGAEVIIENKEEK